MSLETYQYKLNGVMVRITKTMKMLPTAGRRRARKGTSLPGVFLINVEGKRDSAMTLGKARKRAASLAGLVFKEQRMNEVEIAKAKDLFAKTGVPF